MDDRTSIDRRRETEDEALELGRERADLRRRLDENMAKIRALLETAIERSISVEQFARLVGVHRQSVYRWRAEAQGQPRSRDDNRRDERADQE